MTWLDYIKKEDLPEDYPIMADAIGLENTIKLAQLLSGVYIYLKKPDKLFKPAKVKYILDQYNQCCPDKTFNHRRIAIDTGLSIREVYDVLENSHAKHVLKT